MKQLTFFIMIVLAINILHAQNSDYDKLWNNVDQLESEGLPKSALEIVQQISELAKEEQNEPQYIKALLFKSKYALILEEDAQLTIINDFKAEIKNSQAPTRNVLENMLATMYWQYFQQNRWKFYNRTNTSEKVDKTDFRTWDLETLFAEIQLHYQNSLQNGLILQQTKLEDYAVIINEQKNSKLFRPTLYDLLAHNALEFYKTDENSITKPAYKFEINDPDYLSDASAFSRLKLSSKDSTSLQLHALKIYQDLIQFHLKDASPEALADVDINRLQFVIQHATFSNKEDVLLQTLKASRNFYGSQPVSGLYSFEIAQLWYQQGSQYQPKTDETHQWKIKESFDLCQSVISAFPKSIGAEKCVALKQRILQPSLQLQIENYIPIQQESRLLVRYKNINALDFKAYKLTNKQFEIFNKTYRTEDQIQFFRTLNLTQSWDANLRDVKDYQQHSTEVLVPLLANGRYLIVAKVHNSDIFAAQTIQVTNMALVDKTENHKQSYQFIDRNNGNPIEDVTVSISYKKNYNGGTKHKTLTSNTKGTIEIEKSGERWTQVKIEAKTPNDKAYFGDFYINNYQKHKPDPVSYKGFLFTDRSIYRPGQTVYFKGIAIKTDNGKSEVLANENTYVILYDVNNQEVSRLDLQTNAFGSVSGEFILPSSGLTGQFRIKLLGKIHTLSNAQTIISVEEYKRPKFETSLKPITETFKINDSVTVNGNAQAYAGSNITNAKVVYRVQRKVRYPSWYYWYRPAFGSEPQEITHGETITNDKGEFEIIFKAIPDLSVDKDSQPIFNYEVTADVTDINGETRSATSIVNVGYHAMTASISVDNLLDKTSREHKLEIMTQNLNGEIVPAKGTIKIYKLKAPDYVLRTRPWQAPDYPMLPEAEFKSKFPHDAYQDEHNPNNWEKGKLVFEKRFDTETAKTIALGNIKKWQSGQYVIILESQDAFGQHVKAEAKTSLYSDQDKTLADKQLFSITTNKPSYQANETVLLTIGSVAQNVTVTLDVEKDNETINTYVFELNNSKKTIEIPVTKDDLGGFAVHYSFAFANGFQSGMEYINVPYPKTDLEIETTTFRDKLQPGQDETWSFKIKGTKGEQVSAELLASMYDASLDQFKLHDWSFNPIYNQQYNSSNSRNAGYSFGTRNFKVQNFRLLISYPHQAYDQLNWFGFDFSNNWAGPQYWEKQRYLQQHNIKEKIEKFDKSKIKDGYFAGFVSDENGLPLPGVNVIIKGNTEGTQTNFDGYFSIKADKDDILVLSFVGYLTSNFKISKTNFLSFQLEPDPDLDEVVITALGIKRESVEIGYQTEKDSVSFEHQGRFTTADDLENPEYYFTANKIKIVPSDSIVTGSSNMLIADVPKTSFDDIVIRKNLQETAFFFPQLKTDAEGNVSFSFTTPEALTQWKLQLLAHTKTLESAVTSLETVTQKELMVLPNTPRFLRHDDKIVISTKIANLSDRDLSGQAQLQLFNAVSGEEITNELISSKVIENFSVEKAGNTEVSWNLSIPDTVNAVQYKVVAKAGDFSDGEQNALPVLSNRMLVTETLPMWIKSNETRTFTLDKLKTNTSTTLKHHKLTLEMTSNPAWYAVQALPYLMEYPYDCNEQTFSRYYANALASHIANSNPRIQEVFNQWRNTDALLSNLEKNEDLKNILIQETPWLRDAQSETEQKKRIALLFDLNKMNNELQNALRKLEQNQMSNGAWPWFHGGQPNRFITQHIITGFGHLKHLNVIQNDSEESMITKAIHYLDSEFIEEYKDLTKYNKDVDLSKDHLSHTQLHYLYMRSFFPEVKQSKKVQEVSAYYLSQIQKYWLSRSLYSKGLMALITHRMSDNATASKILKSLKENSITNEELGMYWKENTASWYWYQAPIETQALLIEAFSEIENDVKTIDNLKIWLLKNKQTNKWETTKATTEAVYALLLQGSDWLSVTEAVDVLVGGEKLEPSKLENVKVEAGTGYYKTSWNTQEIQPKMAEVTLTKKGNGIAWGGLYWQYFEDLDNITSAETPLKLKKKLFKKINTDTGEEITEITNDTDLKIGDLVRVRIELRSDRDMEFIHMKDMRASSLEPVNVLSQYKWQDGLGYYESTKDASTNFFFDYLPKGVYVFEYDLRANNAGNMSNGITTIQSMYAPEFSSHSEGVRISVIN
ncbi:alpha-2-macroglobulin family protein [Hanstruepera ponticola]|uniref:alpha-2-macroglobulin family protein n=1 Tax=Hanstruepera ponticola TaxID=2042995 RepID=UPI001E45A6CD|nr:MG2 domain-containing protein [Hanstruepera ponticola]